MHWLSVFGIAFGAVRLLKGVMPSDALSCYRGRQICWLDDKSPESEEELRLIRATAHSLGRAYRLEPHKTAASFLNRSFILPAYQGRSFYVEKMEQWKNRAVVWVSFDDATHMAFCLERPLLDGKRDVWVVRQYAYPDEQPLG